MSKFGLLKALLLQLEQTVGYITDIGSVNQFKSKAANTAVTHHANRTFSLVEVDFPFHVKFDKNETSFDIRSIGYDNFNGDLTHNVSAHPKVDRRTGDFLAFGYGLGANSNVSYSLFDKNRKLITSLKIPISSPRMLHDFAITEKNIIIPDLPMENDPKKVIRGERPYFW